MKNLEDIKQTLIRCKPWMQEQYRVTQLGIFGSYIRGEQTETSDVDILVEFDPAFHFGLLTFCELESALSDQVGVKVDLVMKKALKPRIGERILQEVVYL